MDASNEEEELDELPTDAQAASSGGGAGKKKKKKPKKKKSDGAGTGATPLAAAPAGGAGGAAERYASALEALKGGTELWLSLSGCNVGDKKARKVIEALKQPEQSAALTSIDLSNNLMSDASATALGVALQNGACSRLLDLNLSGNPLTADGVAAVASALATRTEVALILPRVPSSATDAEGAGGAAADGLGSADMQRYLGDDPVGSTDAASASLDSAMRLISSLRAGDTCGAAHCAASATLLSSVLEELNEAPASNPKLLPRAMRWCAKNCAALSTLLRCAPTSAKPAGAAAAAGSAAEPGAAGERVGRHRLFAVETVAALTRARRAALNTALLESRPCVVREAVGLMLSHPTSSPIHLACLKLARELLGPGGAKPLRTALFTDGPAAHPPAVPMATLLAEAALRPAPHRRVVRGPVLTLLSELAAAAEADKQLGARLAECPRWAELAEALPELIATTTPAGQLCGPPPERPAVTDGSGRINGEEAELMALLSRLGADDTAKLVTG